MTNPAIEKLARELYAVAVKADAKYTARSTDKYDPYDKLYSQSAGNWLALARHVRRREARIRKAADALIATAVDIVDAHAPGETAWLDAVDAYRSAASKEVRT